MAGYRIFELSRTGRLTGPSIMVHYRSDAEALGHAAAQCWVFGYEVWCGSRKAFRVFTELVS